MNKYYLHVQMETASCGGEDFYCTPDTYKCFYLC